MRILIMILLVAWNLLCYAGSFDRADLAAMERFDVRREVIVPSGPITDEVAEEIWRQHPEYQGFSVVELTKELNKVSQHLSRRKHRSAVIALVRAGAVARIERDGSARVLTDALYYNDLQLAEYLLRKKVPINIAGGSQLCYIHTPEALALLKKYSIDFRPLPGKDSALSLLMERISIEHLLPDFAFLANHIGVSGYTPLTYVALHTDSAIEMYLQLQALIYHGAKRYHRITSGYYTDLTAAQIMEERMKNGTSKRFIQKDILDMLNFLNSSHAPTLAERSLRTICISADSADVTTARHGESAFNLLQLPVRMPAAFAMMVEELSMRAKRAETTDVAALQERSILSIRRKISQLEMLQQSCMMNQELILEYDKERRKPNEQKQREVRARLARESNMHHLGHR